MAFYHRIPFRTLWLIPAIYFALIGVYDIGSDAWDHTLTLYHFIFNLFLIIPLLVNHKLIHLLFGILYLIGSLYILLVLLYFATQYLNGKHFRYPFDTFVIGPIFCVLSILCSVSLIYAGSKKHNTIA